MWESEVLAKLGEDGIQRLIREFYSQIPEDPLLGPMYPEDDLDAAEERLRDFVIFRLGGSPRYIQERGHPRLRQRHVPFPVDQAARDRWVQLMDKAFVQSEVPEDLATPLREFFADVATFLINR